MLIESRRSDFLLIDVPRPYRAVAVALPSNQHLVVLPADRGVIATMYLKKQRLKKSLQFELPGVDGQLQLALKIFGMLTLRSHLAIPREIFLEEEGLVAAPVPRQLPTLYQPLQVYPVLQTCFTFPR
jgi:hypothetical protein